MDKYYSKLNLNLIKRDLTKTKVQNEFILALLCKLMQKKGEPDLYKQVSEIIDDHVAFLENLEIKNIR